MNTPSLNPAIDTEALRLYYLQQLGVSVYARRDNAVASDIVAETEPDVPARESMPAVAAPKLSSTVEPTVQPTAVPTIVASGPRKPLLDDDAEPVSARPAPKVTAKTAATAANEDSAAIASFQLLFCFPQPQVAVALQIPALAKPVLPEAESRLLQNLLRWLGIRNDGLTGAMLHFRWPLPGMPAGDEKAAGRNLQVFLQQAAATQPLQRLLLLGQGPALCLEAAGAELPFQTWATHSLAEMLAVPELKREVWRQLLSLHEQL